MINLKPRTVTVSFRLPLSAYQRAVTLAQQRGEKKLSKVLRPALVAGLDVVEAQQNGGQQGGERSNDER